MCETHVTLRTLALGWGTFVSWVADGSVPCAQCIIVIHVSYTQVAVVPLILRGWRLTFNMGGGVVVGTLSFKFNA